MNYGQYGKYPYQNYGDYKSPNYGSTPLKSKKDSFELQAIKALKKVTGSVLMLLLAITCTITTIFTVIDLIVGFSGFAFIISGVKIVLSVIICIGVWGIFIKGRSDDTSATGFKLVKGVIQFRYILIMIIVVLALIGIVVAAGFMSQLGGQIDAASGAEGELSISLNVMLFIMLGVIIAAVAVLIMFFKSVIGSLKCAKILLESQRIERNNYYMGAVILIIIGIAKVIMMFLTNSVSAVIGTVFDKMAGESESLGGIGDSMQSIFKQDWTTIITNICDMLNYILGGIILIVYARKINAIQKAKTAETMSSYNNSL